MESLSRREFAALAAGSAVVIPFTVSEADGAVNERILGHHKTKFTLDDKYRLRLTGTLKKTKKICSCIVTFFILRSKRGQDSWIRAKRVISTRRTTKIRPVVYTFPKGQYALVLQGKGMDYDLKVEKSDKKKTIDKDVTEWEEVANMVGTVKLPGEIDDYEPIK